LVRPLIPGSLARIIAVPGDRRIADDLTIGAATGEPDSRRASHVGLADPLGFQAVQLTVAVAAHHEELTKRITDDQTGELRRVVEDTDGDGFGQPGSEAKLRGLGQQFAEEANDAANRLQVCGNLGFDRALQVSDDTA
jgi:hypothetical protein